MKFKTLLFLILFFLVSCAPQSKEAYLEKYKDFMDEVGTEYESYTKEDWLKADEKFKKISEDWYVQFEDQFTWQEEVLIGKYKFQYNLFKAKKYTRDFLDENWKDDYDMLKAQIKFYIENDMDEDIKFLMEQARELGDSAVSLIKQIFKELEIEINVEKDE